ICKIGYSSFNRVKDRLAAKLQTVDRYLHFTLVKENWDTIRALNYIRKKIGVSLKRFGISGMKDKQAITAQRVSLWKGNIKDMIRLKLPDIFLKDFEYADERITLGNAIGNRFVITIRDSCKKNEEILDILNRFKEIVTSQGVPNYYGPQRLGGRNADVGKAIINGNLKLATEIILKKIQPFLVGGGVKSIPRVFWYEKNMLRHLAKFPNDYAGAIRKIPKRIRRLYTHAYQSYIFNEKLGQKLLKKRVPKTIIVQGYTVPTMPELNTIPIERNSYLIAKDFKTLMVKNGIVKIRFTLPSGGYASTLLSHL
ncbi:MAG: tRNA pseudouridine(13) synthase TruD, partial [Candidatus Bathyarchaeota archaeon]